MTNVRPAPMTRLRARGFSMIELLVAVIIVGIIAAVAFPSYQDSVRKGRRADAEAFLMNLAQIQQQYFLDARAYATTAAGLNATVPTSVSTYYTLTEPFTTTSTTFSLSAVPIGTQAADSCGTLTINSVGTKSSSAGSNCW